MTDETFFVIRAHGGYFWGGHSFGWVGDIKNAAGMGAHIYTAEKNLQEFKEKEPRFSLVKDLEIVLTDGKGRWARAGEAFHE